MFYLVYVHIFQIEVGDLDFLTYSSLEDLREQEDCCMYPPRFKISVVRLSRGNILDTEFKVFFENDGNMKEFRRFSLTVAELNNEATSSKIVNIISYLAYACSITKFPYML